MLALAGFSMKAAGHKLSANFLGAWLDIILPSRLAE
jgi:hypothetical protein